jgi:hypothetical protein
MAFFYPKYLKGKAYMGSGPIFPKSSKRCASSGLLQSGRAAERSTFSVRGS